MMDFSGEESQGCQCCALTVPAVQHRLGGDFLWGGLNLFGSEMFNQHLQCKAMLQMIKQELVFIKVNVKLLRSAKEEICRAWYGKEHEWVMRSNSGSKESFNVPCHPVCLWDWGLGPSAGRTGSNEVLCGCWFTPTLSKAVLWMSLCINVVTLETVLLLPCTPCRTPQ